MRISYNRKDDIATIELGRQKIDHAQEAENVIIHLSKDDDPVMLEILDASKFLTNLMKASMTSKTEKPVSV